MRKVELSVELPPYTDDWSLVRTRQYEIARREGLVENTDFGPFLFQGQFKELGNSQGLVKGLDLGAAPPRIIFFK